jgi:hypothetical protein
MIKIHLTVMFILTDPVLMRDDSHHSAIQAYVEILYLCKYLIQRLWISISREVPRGIVLLTSS